MSEQNEDDHDQSGEFRELSQQEILQLSPVERAVYKVKRDFHNYSEDFKTAGVDEETRMKVVSAAEGRVRREYAELEKQDPINVLGNLLHSVQKDNPNLVGIQYHQYLLGPLNQLQRCKGLQYEGVYLPEEVKGYIPSEYFARVVIRNDEKGKRILRYQFPVQTRETVYPDPRHSSYNAAQMSDEQIEQLLRKIGALEDGQTMRDLENSLPNYYQIKDQKHSPYRANGDREPKLSNYGETKPAETLILDQIKTNLPGVEVQIRPYDLETKLVFSLDQAALDRALSNPNNLRR